MSANIRRIIAPCKVSGTHANMRYYYEILTSTTGENRYRVEAISEAEALEKFQRNEAELVEEKILTESGPSTIIALEDPELKKAA